MSKKVSCWEPFIRIHHQGETLLEMSDTNTETVTIKTFGTVELTMTEIAKLRDWLGQREYVKSNQATVTEYIQTIKPLYPGDAT